MNKEAKIYNEIRNIPHGDSYFIKYKDRFFTIKRKDNGDLNVSPNNHRYMYLVMNEDNKDYNSTAESRVMEIMNQRLTHRR